MNIEKLAEILRAFGVHGHDNIDIHGATGLIEFYAPKNIVDELKETLDWHGVRWSDSDQCWYIWT